MNKLEMTNRNLSLLDNVFRKKVEAWLKDCPEIFITEGWRSKERQAYLYSKGRTIAGKKVTWTLNSLHCKGLAVDIAFRQDDLYPSDINKWTKIANSAIYHGIDWGYNLWGCDLPHFQNSNKIPDIYNLIKMVMENELQDLQNLNKIVCDKVIGSIENDLSALWNLVDPKYCRDIESIKKRITGMRFKGI